MDFTAEAQRTLRRRDREERRRGGGSRMILEFISTYASKDQPPLL
jgi:hypothetical protein